MNLLLVHLVHTKKINHGGPDDFKAPQTTASGSYAYGWQQMKKYFLPLFLVTLIAAIADSLVSSGNKVEFYNSPEAVILKIIVAAYWLLLLPVIKYGADLLFLRGARNEKIEMKVMFDGFKKNYLNIVLAHLLTAALIGIGIIMLIIPGIIVACRLAFVSYLVMDKGLEPIAAVEKSWAMTKGHGWTIFGMALLAILIAIAGLICLVVGILFSIQWISTAFASFYHAVDVEHATDDL